MRRSLHALIILLAGVSSVHSLTIHNGPQPELPAEEAAHETPPLSYHKQKAAEARKKLEEARLHKGSKRLEEKAYHAAVKYVKAVTDGIIESDGVL